jgi:hypothetical protein
MSRHNPPSPPKRAPTKKLTGVIPKAEPDTFLILKFITSSGYQLDPVEIPLKFDSNGNYKPINGGYTNLESGVFFHLIKRASDRLALNTTNDNLQRYKTELVSISGGEINDNGSFNVMEIIPLDEIRQYTNAQKVKAVLKAGVAGLATTVTGALDVAGALAPAIFGAEVGSDVGKNIGGSSGELLGAYAGANIGNEYASDTNVSGITKNIFQGILGDEYLANDKKNLFLNRQLFLNNKTYFSDDGKYIEADVPFNITISDLVFPKSLETGETYTLYIEGMFLGVHIASTGYDVTHGDASNLYIKDTKILQNTKNKKQVKKILQSCKNDSECIYFKPEI